ncbi:MAG TPA: glutamate 5-kinase [Lachnospiraceae bacterium]|nr:glutamate 5-kinase [Lachnospiraceae bacterium]
MNDRIREKLKDKKRIVIKIGSSSLAHKDTGKLDLIKLEILVRELSDLRNQGKDVVLVSSGAIMVGQHALNLSERPDNLNAKQACASIGQARLMMIYQKLFSEYNQMCGQILMTKNTMLDNLNRFNARNTFNELLHFGVIPIVNENDTIATYEIDSMSVFGDNDRLSAVVAALIEADLLILLSDIDGFYTDDPHRNPEARFIPYIEDLDDDLMAMGKSTTGSSAGSGGMSTKLSAARIATAAGADMVIASGDDFHVIHKLIRGENIGTIFKQDKKDMFYLLDYLEKVI